MKDSHANADPDVDHPLPGARSALFLLLAINLFNYIDRQVLAAVVPSVRKAFLSHGAAQSGCLASFLSWFQHAFGFRPENALMGLLSMAFMVVYMTGAPVFARLSEHRSRWALVGGAVMAWSLASGASGIAATFGALLLTRCCVGIGEAAYAPVAQSVLSDMYPLSQRGRVLAWFNMAIPVGSALGYVLGGSMAGAWPESGWRWAFGVVVLPGLLLGWLALKRGRRDAQSRSLEQHVEKPCARHRWQDYRELLFTPSYLLCTAGMCGMTFAMGGIGFWMVDYVQTCRGVGTHAAEVFGVILVVSGFSATWLGGLVGDRLRHRWPGSYFLVSGVAMILGFPAFLLVLDKSIPFPLAWVFVFATCFFLFFSTGPTNAILANVTRPALRPMAFALNILLIHALGDVPSPLVIGLVSDRCQGDMTVAFRGVAALFVLSGVLWLLGARVLARDTDRVAAIQTSC